MANPVIRGDNTILWGAGGVFSGTGAGIIQTGRKRKNCEKVEIKDVNGFTVAVVYFDNKTELEFEMYVKTAAPAINEGDGLTICGVAYALVDEVEEMWANNDGRKYRVRATNYVAIEEPEA